jgi:hypothetical protein
VEMKQSISWSMARVDREIGVGAGRERVMRRMREGCLTRFARSMQHDSIEGSLGSWALVRKDSELPLLDVDGGAHGGVQKRRQLQKKSMLLQ